MARHPHRRGARHQGRPRAPLRRATPSARAREQNRPSFPRTGTYARARPARTIVLPHFTPREPLKSATLPACSTTGKSRETDTPTHTPALARASGHAITAHNYTQPGKGRPLPLFPTFPNTGKTRRTTLQRPLPRPPIGGRVGKGRRATTTKEGTTTPNAQPTTTPMPTPRMPTPPTLPRPQEQRSSTKHQRRPLREPSMASPQGRGPRRGTHLPRLRQGRSPTPMPTTHHTSRPRPRPRRRRSPPRPHQRPRTLRLLPRPQDRRRGPSSR